MCHTVAQIRRQEPPMCLAEVIVRPLTMRLLDPWHFRRPHRFCGGYALQLQPRLACKVVAGMQRLLSRRMQALSCCSFGIWGGGGTTTTTSLIINNHLEASRFFGPCMFLNTKRRTRRGECGGVFCGQKTGLDIRTPPERDVRSHQTPPRSPPRGDGTNREKRRHKEARRRAAAGRGEAAAEVGRPSVACPAARRAGPTRPPCSRSRPASSWARRAGA